MRDREQLKRTAVGLPAQSFLEQIGKEVERLLTEPGLASRNFDGVVGSLQSYVASVAVDVVRDHRRGKWRASEAAKALGPEEPQDLPVLERETREQFASALKKALDSLSPEDRLIARMSVVDNLKIVDVARILRMEQKPLYRRREKILRKLRSALEREGVRWEHAGRTASDSHIPADPDLKSAALINAEIDDLYSQIWSQVSGCKGDANLPATVAPLRQRLRELQRQEADMMEQQTLAQLRFDPVEGDKFLEESRRMLGKKR